MDPFKRGEVGRRTRASAETWPGFQGKHHGRVLEHVFVLICTLLSVAAPVFVCVITNISLFK